MYRRYFLSTAIILFIAIADGAVIPAGAASSPDKPQEPGGDIALRDALSLALQYNPELAAFSIEVRVAEARTLQAGLRPNPEVNIEVENFAGSGTLRSFDGAETTFQIGQLIELAGKRPKRARVASLERDLAGWDYEAKRADVLAETSKSFVDVLAGQERLTLTQELLRLAEQTFDAVSARVKAGKVSPVEETKAGVALSNSRIEHARAQRSLEAARKKLVAAWGSGVPAFERAVGPLDRVAPPPPADRLTQEIRGNPDIARWATEKEQRRTAAALQDAIRIPDPTLAAGVRHFSESGNSAFVAGASVPLPLFNRNQGGILESRRRLAKAETESAAAEAKVRTALADTYQALSTAVSEIDALKTTVLPGAQSAFEAASEGYRQGKFGYLDILDAQRTLFEARGQYVSALATYHKALADLDRAIGRLPDAAGQISETKRGVSQ
jgi:cobalt-zinc-cadmium efflux system outer membrane protein